MFLVSKCLEIGALPKCPRGQSVFMLIPKCLVAEVSGNHLTDDVVRLDIGHSDGHLGEGGQGRGIPRRPLSPTPVD